MEVTSLGTPAPCAAHSKVRELGGTEGVTYWGDSSTVEVHRLWHGSWQLDPLESLEVQLPNISQNHLSVVAPAHEHICKRGDVGPALPGTRDRLGESSGIPLPTQDWDQELPHLNKGCQDLPNQAHHKAEAT